MQSAGDVRQDEARSCLRREGTLTEHPEGGAHHVQDFVAEWSVSEGSSLCYISLASLWKGAIMLGVKALCTYVLKYSYEEEGRSRRGADAVGLLTPLVGYGELPEEGTAFILGPAEGRDVRGAC